MAFRCFAGNRRVWPFAAAFVFLIAFSAAADDASNLHRFTLDNGMRVWDLERNDSDSVAVCLSMQVGSRNETKENNGISHFVEHMTFAGSERYDRTTLMEMIDKRGGVQNAFTMEERTIFCAQISAEHFELLMDWLSQVVFHPTFPADRVDGERNVIIDEKGGKKGWLRETVEALGQKVDLGQELREGLFPDSTLTMSVIGEDKSLASIDHDQLVAYYRAHYMPNNATLLVAGKVAPDRLERACREYFGAINPGTKPRSCAAPPEAGKPIKEATLHGITFTKQCTLMMGVRTCSIKDPDRWPLDVLAELLSTTLMREGRLKRALAYDIHVDNQCYSDTGLFQVFTQCTRTNMKALRPLIDKQIDDIRQGKVSETTLKEAKESLNGRWSLYLETNMSRIMWLEQLASTYGDNAELPDRKAQIDAVTAEDLARVVKQYFVPERTCVAQHIPLM
jgi:predicted Zn-dependent peptidase